MAKQALALKYRPRKFEDVVEQDAIKATLMQQLKTNTIQHCYLFTGPAGCGKTTDARIFASEINKGKGIPIELDAASNNSVDDIRRIVEDSKYKSMTSEYKVYIIDECFSGNTLVKTINGNKPIKDINVGETIYSLYGEDIVEAKSINKVDVNRLTKVTLSNNENILTTKDHLFFTQNGWKQAQLLCKGDVLIDYQKLCYLWENISMLSKRWKENLFKRMYVYITRTTDEATLSEQHKENKEDLSSMSERIYDISFNQFNYLWERLCQTICETTWINSETKRIINETQTSISMSSMWKDYDGTKQSKSQILFKRMFKSISKDSEPNETEYKKGSCLCYMWEYIFKEIFTQYTDLFQRMQKQINFDKEYRTSLSRETQTKYERKQSFNESRNYDKNKENQGEKWYTSQVDWETWWQWSLYDTTNDIISSIRNGLDIGTFSTNKNEERYRLSNELQDRYSQSEVETGYRSRWFRSLIEGIARTGFEENNIIGNIGVESVEIFKRGNNEQSFRSYFTDTELHSEYVEMYDLQVKNHPSYIVNNILVHNCHMISNSGWNAFLKTIEEPPAYAIYLLCTTDPQKIPNTILSRVQRYDFRKISFNGIVNRLKYIIENENSEGSNITYTDDAIEYIAKLCDGGMRDSITTLDKCLSYNNNLTLENVTKALGTVNYDILFDLTDYVYNYDTNNVIETIESIYMSGANIKQFIKDYTLFVLDLCKYGLNKSFTYVQIPSLYKNRLDNYDNNAYAFFVQLLGEMTKLSTNIKWESSPKPTIESTFILLCQKG